MKLLETKPKVWNSYDVRPPFVMSRKYICGAMVIIEWASVSSLKTAYSTTHFQGQPANLGVSYDTLEEAQIHLEQWARNAVARDLGQGF